MDVMDGRDENTRLATSTTITQGGSVFLWSLYGVMFHPRFILSPPSFYLPFHLHGGQASGAVGGGKV